jgi:alpha-L-arabinofuranosidase
LNTTLRRNNADIIDEHYYRRPEWFLQNAKRYDDYPRNGSKVFAGEYAAQSDKTVSVNNQNSWITALSEAAFMTGLERNADVVCMASYAPLFSNVDGWQWTPDLIWVNNLKTYGTPDYYVQKMYSLNKGSKVVPITLNNDVIAGQDSLYASAVVDDKTNELIIKLVNVSSQQKTNTISLQGVKSLAGVAKLMVMQSNNLNAVNTFDQETILPKESSFIVKNRAFALIVLPYSFSVLRIKLIPEQMSVKKEKSDKG